MILIILTLLMLTASIISCTQPSEPAEKSEERPNVVVILTDDQGWGDLSLNGNSNLSTPNIDTLARGGASFDQFYVCQVCAPTRAEFLTGRYHSRGGVYGVSRGQERLNPDEKTIADTFRAAGYSTAAFGKWHNGTQHPYHPNARGFDEFYGFCSGHWGNYFDPILEHNGEIVRGEGFIIDDLTSRAIEFIEQNRTEPFFVYLAYNTPHSPMQVPDDFFEKFEAAELGLRNRDPEREDVAHTRAALAMCENIDWNVGRVLQKLDEQAIADNTIVVYFSDNGPNGWRWNGGMKGRKGSLDEGGLRVPFFIRWPGHIEAETRISEVTAAIDILPTLADLADIPLVSSEPLDGISFSPLLFGRTGDWPDRLIFSIKNVGRSQPPQVSVRTQRYRLDSNGQLFDIAADPGQNRDVSESEPEIATRLASAASSWQEEVVPKVTLNRPFTVGYGASTTLPARDGVASGQVERSARAPNCSFFTHWTDVEDRISWDVEVARSGRYECVVYYTCPENDIGSTVELNLGETIVQVEVTDAHDPPLVGATFDRVSRGSESYVKDFKPLTLGVLSLEKGRGDLVLRATEIPGEQVMDVHSLVLTFLD
jgi:arylsulfatase A-like enzyme